MVKKFRPGLSETFTLDVAPIGDLGDYLDEPGPSPLTPKRVVTFPRFGGVQVSGVDSRQGVH